ncbi:MAG: CRISPR-associated endonuclease Cas2 [Nitrospirae bacterium]|nr:MAG: CRISPR-associated endonuclease Cas2 [Nitrospirota bacterium]
MSTRKLYLVAYDISEPRRLARALEVCREYATGGQKSVHECWLTDAEKREILERLAAVIDEQEDRVHLFRLDPRMEVRAMGIGVKPEDGDFFFIG